MIFDKLQKFLDRMNVVLRENITGVRVIRAFNKEKYEEKRMRKSFEDYAESSIKANRLFAGLESIALLAINLCIVSILYLGGNRIGAGFMADRRHHRSDAVRRHDTLLYYHGSDGDHSDSQSHDLRRKNFGCAQSYAGNRRRSRQYLCPLSGKKFRRRM